VDSGLKLKGSIMTTDDIELVTLLAAYANRHFSGHLTIMKFTGNWRVGFGTPHHANGFDTGDVEMTAGKTFREAALKALLNPQRVDCVTWGGPPRSADSPS